MYARPAFRQAIDSFRNAIIMMKRLLCQNCVLAAVRGGKSSDVGYQGFLQGEK